MTDAVITAQRSAANARAAVLDALRGMKGRATVADIVAATGLVPANAEATLRSILETHTGHVEVGERGDLVYAFAPDLLTRDHVPWWRRVANVLKRVGRVLFKAWIAITLVAYFVVFLVLAVAAVVVVVARGGDDVKVPGRRSVDWLWFLFWAPDWRWGAPYYGDRWERRAGRRRVPFYKKVFAFVFGPDEPQPTAEQRDRERARLVRSHAGVLTAADLLLHDGGRPAGAHEELGRLLGKFDGEVRATQDGEVVYQFPDLMVSAHGAVRESTPDPAWRRLLPERPLTGNSRLANAAIAGMNAFNLVGVASAVTVVFPTLGRTGPVLWTGLVWVPLTFSVLFFAIPLVRALGVRRENQRRRAENVRRLVLGYAFDAALAREALSVVAVTDRVRAALPDARVTEQDIESVLRTLVADLDGDVTVGSESTARYTFDRLRESLEAGQRVRAALDYRDRRVGEIVYSSADSPEAAARRELDAFDRELRRSLEPDRVAWQDEFELLEPPPGTGDRRAGGRTARG